MALHLFHLGQSRPNGLDVCLRCLGLCWQRVLALGSETLIPSSAHVSCPSTHTRWFVGMFDSVRLVTGSLDGGRGCGTLARAIYIHSFIQAYAGTRTTYMYRYCQPAPPSKLKRPWSLQPRSLSPSCARYTQDIDKVSNAVPGGDGHASCRSRFFWR